MAAPDLGGGTNLEVRCKVLESGDRVNGFHGCRSPGVLALSADLSRKITARPVDRPVDRA
jgi:hypothetical protein